MKYNTIIAISLFFLFSACQTEDLTPEQEAIVGTWTLTEVLSDPGNGSGTFQAVTSTATIQFMADSTYEATLNLCSMDISIATTQGVYSPTNKTISPSNCQNQPLWAISYEVNNQELILSLPCIEPCQQKYVRAD